MVDAEVQYQRHRGRRVREVASQLDPVVPGKYIYFESIKRELKIRPIYECRCEVSKFIMNQ